MNRRETIRLGIMIMAAVAGTFWVSQLFLRVPKPSEPSSEAPVARSDVPQPDPEAGKDDEAVEVPVGGDVLPPDGGAPARPVSPEFLANLQAALQETVDGTPELEGRAFDYLVDYSRQIDWAEVNERADPTLLSEIHAGMNLDKMNPALLANFQAVWAKSRGRWVEVEGKVYNRSERTLPAPIEGISTVHEVLLRNEEENLWVQAILLEPPQGEKVLVKGVFFKIRSLEVGGARLDVAVLVGKGTGSGTRPVVAGDEAYERKLFDAVRDMSSGWIGQGVFHLLRKSLALDPAELERRCVAGLLDRIAIPPQVGDEEGAEELYARMVEEHRPVWSEVRGQFLCASGRLAWVKDVEIPEGVVPGRTTAYWGRLKEDGTGRLFDFVVAEKPESPKDSLVTLRGAFYKMCRYQEKVERQVKNGLWFFPVFVGRSLQAGVVHPQFRPEQFAKYLDLVGDQNDLIQTESYYYFLWWLGQTDQTQLAKAADPALAEKLRVNRYRSISKDEEARLQEAWVESRGKPVQIRGSLIYVSEEPIPTGRAPVGFPHQKVWTGMIKMADYHLCAFTALSKGDLQPDRGVRMTGIFFKSWKYTTRTGQIGDAIYVLADRIEPIPDPGQPPWMRTFGAGLMGVVVLATVGILIAVVVARLRGDGERARERRPRSGGGPAAPSPDPTAPTAGPGGT